MKQTRGWSRQTEAGPHQYLRKGFNNNMLDTFIMIGYGNTHEQVKVIVKAMEKKFIDEVLYGANE